MRRYRGFTLVEILVSLALVGLVLAVASVLVSTTELSRSARHAARAREIAESALESARAEGSVSLETRVLADPRLAELPHGAGILTVAPYAAGLAEVTAEVSWRDSQAAESRSFSLTTLIAQEGGI